MQGTLPRPAMFSSNRAGQDWVCFFSFNIFPSGQGKIEQGDKAGQGMKMLPCDHLCFMEITIIDITTNTSNASAILASLSSILKADYRGIIPYCSKIVHLDL